MELSIGSSLAFLYLPRSSALLALCRPVSSLCRAATTSPRQQAEQGGNAAPSGTFRLAPANKVQQRKPQWSRGDAPGEYGGPPLTLKIRPSWGGLPAEDPLTAREDYIWKKIWQPYVEVPPSNLVPPKPPNTKEPDSGFLSPSRSVSLESMDVDLSEELMTPFKPALQPQLEGATPAAAQNDEPAKPRWRFTPTKQEEEQWARGRKVATGGLEVIAREVGRAQIDVVGDAERQRLWYIERSFGNSSTLGSSGLGDDLQPIECAVCTPIWSYALGSHPNASGFLHLQGCYNNGNIQGASSFPLREDKDLS